MASNSITLNREETRLDLAEERNASQAMARAQQEVQGAIILAKKFPRNEDAASMALWRSCKRTTFADRAEYSFPRGSKKNANGQWEKNFVTGPSAKLAREAVRCWGNLQVGTEIVRDTREERHIRSFAWDMETNTRRTSEASFRKLIQRKQDNGKTEWVEPDERDLRELTNKHASIAERNCSLQLIPTDIIEEAVNICRATMQSETKKDPEAARRKIILAFADINVTVAMLETYIGHALAQCSPAEIDDLRAVWASINEGNSTWADYIAPAEGDDAPRAKHAAEAAGAAATAAANLADKYVKKPKPEQQPASDEPPVSAYDANEATSDPTLGSRPESGQQQPELQPQSGAKEKFNPFAEQPARGRK